MAYSIYMAEFNIQNFIQTSMHDDEGVITGLNELHTTPNENNPFRDILIRSNSSYSGTDCSVIAQVNQKLISLGNVETFSYSIFREKVPVRTLGRSGPKAYTGGARTIGGSLVFVVFDRHPLLDVVKEMKYNPRSHDSRSTSPVADQISPIDLFLVFRNEYGHESLLKLYGVEFLQEGQTHSINDLYSENVTQYVARDIDIMINSNDVSAFRDLIFQRRLAGQFVDNYLASMLEYKQGIERQIAVIQKNTMENASKKALNPDLSRSIDIENKYNNFKIKDLLAELETINVQIQNYESNLSGWNAQRGDSIAKFDNLEQSPTQTNPFVTSPANDGGAFSTDMNFNPSEIQYYG